MPTAEEFRDAQMQQYAQMEQQHEAFHDARMEQQHDEFHDAQMEQQHDEFHDACMEQPHDEFHDAQMEPQHEAVTNYDEMIEAYQTSVRDPDISDKTTLCEGRKTVSMRK